MVRISAVVFAMVCFLAGYAVSGYRVSAGAEDVDVRRLPSGMHIGDTVTLTFAAGSLASGIDDVDCKITGQSGIWVQCASPASVWYDTTRVAIVKKVAK